MNLTSAFLRAEAIAIKRRPTPGAVISFRLTVGIYRPAAAATSLCRRLAPLRRRTNSVGCSIGWSAGEEITVTRHGKEVARLVPAKPGFNRAEAHVVLRRIRERAEQLKLGASDWSEWKAFRDERRP